MSFNEIENKSDRLRKQDGNIEEQLEKLKNTETREKARLWNIVAGDDIHNELANGRKTYPILADIPAYFKLRLFPERKPPGKIIFTLVKANSPVQVCLSYTNKKPDLKHNSAAKFIGEIHKNAPPLFELKTK